MKISNPPFPFEDFKKAMREAFPCAHVNTRLCADRDARNRWLIRRQCVDCGYLDRHQIKHSILEGLKTESLRGHEVDRAEKFERDILAFRQSLSVILNSARNLEWWRQYSIYLESEEWRRKSRATIAAAGGICTYCNTVPAVQAHHVSYDRVGEELPEDLRAICIACHREEHSEKAF